MAPPPERGTFRFDKYQLVMRLLRESGAAITEHAPEPCPREWLEAVHDPDYVEQVLTQTVPREKERRIKLLFDDDDGMEVAVDLDVHGIDSAIFLLFERLIFVAFQQAEKTSLSLWESRRLSVGEGRNGQTPRETLPGRYRVRPSRREGIN